MNALRISMAMAIVGAFIGCGGVVDIVNEYDDGSDAGDAGETDDGAARGASTSSARRRVKSLRID